MTAEQSQIKFLKEKQDSITIDWTCKAQPHSYIQSQVKVTEKSRILEYG